MWLNKALIGAVLSLVVALPFRSAHATIFAQWVQLGSDGIASARAITDGDCPSVVFDGTDVPMTVRAEPAQPLGNVKPAEFPVRSCEVAVPQGAQTALLDGYALPLPRGNPRRILVFGDTGCRLLGATAQDCNDPTDWPFARIATLAAAAQPDLVIHVGDYHYRENACPVNRSGCAGSPYGYGFDAWYADFFEPAAPLLAAAPWIMVRGNHEDCVRAGEGWFRFLHPAPMEDTCRDLTGVYVAKAGDFGVVVADTAAAADPRGDAAPMADALRQQFMGAADKIPAEAWLATHRPLNAIVAVPDRNSGGTRNVIDNKVQELAFGPIMPDGVRMHVAGHVHFFQAIDFGESRPPQLVVGTGGDRLDNVAPMSMVGADINGKTVASSVTRLGFGYMIWQREGADWHGTLYDVNARPLDRCLLVVRSLSCGR